MIETDNSPFWGYDEHGNYTIIKDKNKATPTMEEIEAEWARIGKWFREFFKEWQEQRNEEKEKA